jgi:hypothetical protein
MHLLKGSFFAYPFESDYGFCRRFLVANHGTTWPVLNHRLEETVSHSVHDPRCPIERIYYHLFGKPRVLTVWSPFTPTRACPECLLQLYHSPIHEFRWLDRCPIHGCSLQSHCLECGEPWPSFKDLVSRRCVMCGRSALKALLEKGLQQYSTDEISLLRSFKPFIKPKQNVLSLTNKGEKYDSDWHALSDVSNSHYGHYFSRCLSAFGDSDITPWKRRIKVREFDIYEKTTKLTPVTYDDYTDEIPLYRASLECERSKAYQEILSFIRAHTGKTHQAHLIDFINTRDYLSDTPPCPFCLALSLWLFQVHAYPFPRRDTHSSRSFTMFSSLQPFEFYPAEALNLVDYDNLQHFKTTRAFATWSYHRQLLMCFVQILECCMYISEKPERCSPWYDNRKQLKALKSISNHYFFVHDKTLVYLYCLRSPLDYFHSLKFKRVTRHCARMVRRLKEESFGGLFTRVEYIENSLPDYMAVEALIEDYLYGDQNRSFNCKRQAWFKRRKEILRYSNTQYEMDFSV